MAVKVETLAGDERFSLVLAEAPGNGPELRRFGKSWELMLLPTNAINVCGQMRTNFEQEPLETLARSLDAEGQFHPLLVMKMDPGLAQKYVDYTNECWGKSVDFADFTSMPDGDFMILDAGERRLRAARILEEWKGVSPGIYGVECKVRRPENISEMLKIQFEENLHEKPATQQYAKSIYQAYYIGHKEGIFPDIASFVKFSSLPEDATRDALRYFELPIKIQDLVETKAISYSTAVELVPLQKVLYEYHQHLAITAEIEAGGLPFTQEEEIIRRVVEQLYTEAVYISHRQKGYDPRNLENKKKWKRDDVRDHIARLIKNNSLNRNESTIEMSIQAERQIKNIQERDDERRRVILGREARELHARLASLKEMGVEIGAELLPGHEPVDLEQQLQL